MTFSFESLARHLPDELWQAFEPVLPPVVWCGNGRPPIDNRTCLHAALYVLISGIGWNLLPACFPCGKTVRKRFTCWMQSDAFAKVWSACAARYQASRGINFDQLSIDGARKPAKKGAPAQAPTPRTAPRAARRSCC